MGKVVCIFFAIVYALMGINQIEVAQCRQLEHFFIVLHPASLTRESQFLNRLKVQFKKSGISLQKKQQNGSAFAHMVLWFWVLWRFTIIRFFN